jgi:hypothetical protein
LGEAFPNMAFSTNHRFLAYTTKYPSVLHINNILGESNNEILIPDEWMGVIKWIDKDSILITHFLDKPVEEASTILHSYNIGSIREFNPVDSPFIYPYAFSQEWRNYGYARIILDSHLMLG